MVIHPRNLNLGERILRFAEWSPRGKQLVGPAAAAAAAPHRPPAGSPGLPAAPGRPEGPEGRRAAGAAPSALPRPGLARWAARPRRFPAGSTAREGRGERGSRRGPESRAPWALPRTRLLLWGQTGRDGRRAFPRSAFTPQLFVSPKPLEQRAPHCCVIDTAGPLAALLSPRSRRLLKAAPAPLCQTATENTDGAMTTSLHLPRPLHPATHPSRQRRPSSSPALALAK